MENEYKICKNCSHYRVYYIKQFVNFDKLDFGFFIKSKQTVDRNHKCELWDKKVVRNRIRKAVCAREVNEILDRLRVVSQILIEDIIENENYKKQKFKCFRGLTLHSKIALSTTGILIIAGAVLVFIFEYSSL